MAVEAVMTAEFWLSIVIIGRNESRWLPGLFGSLPAEAGIECIYVDSISTDNSVEIALRHGAAVYTQDEHPSLCAASGRYIGTREASGRWVLYLDGDMKLKPEFGAFLLRLKEAGEIPAGVKGFVGRTCSYYFDLRGDFVSVRDNVCLPARHTRKEGEWGTPADYHGGAVLYLREAVLQVGSWNPAVSQLEEIDLYSRIRGRGWHIRALDLPMADHFTPTLSRWEKLRPIFFPWKGAKKYYGPGQLLAARWLNKDLASLLRYYPYPFIVFAAILITIPAFIVWKPLPVVLHGALVLFFAVTKKWHYYLVHFGTIIQAFVGLRSYRPFQPGYRSVECPEQAAAAEPGQ